MSFSPLVLVASAALLHAVWNLLAKQAAHVGPTFVFAYNLVCCLAYAPWVLWVVLRHGFPLTAAAAACIVLSGAVHLAYSLCLQRGYQVADLSVVYPVARGAGPLLSALGAFVVLGEAAPPQRISGLLMVVGGIALIATDGNWRVVLTPRGRAGINWGLVTGALIASYSLIDGYAVKAVRIEPVVLDWCSNFERFVVLAPVVLRTPEAIGISMRGRWRLAIGVGVLSPLAYILVLVALQLHAPLSVVAPMREMSMMIGALLGLLVLRERVGAWRLGGCALLIAGILLLTAP